MGFPTWHNSFQRGVPSPEICLLKIDDFVNFYFITHHIFFTFLMRGFFLMKLQLASKIPWEKLTFIVITYLLGGPSSCSNYEKWTCARLDVVGTWRVSDLFRRMFSSLAHAYAQMHVIWNVAISRVSDHVSGHMVKCGYKPLNLKCGYKPHFRSHAFAHMHARDLRTSSVPSAPSLAFRSWWENVNFSGYDGSISQSDLVTLSYTPNVSAFILYYCLLFIIVNLLFPQYNGHMVLKEPSVFACYTNSIRNGRVLVKSWNPQHLF